MSNFLFILMHKISIEILFSKMTDFFHSKLFLSKVVQTFFHFWTPTQNEFLYLFYDLFLFFLCIFYSCPRTTDRRISKQHESSWWIIQLKSCVIVIKKERNSVLTEYQIKRKLINYSFDIHSIGSVIRSISNSCHYRYECKYLLKFL